MGLTATITPIATGAQPGTTVYTLFAQVDGGGPPHVATLTLETRDYTASNAANLAREHFNITDAASSDPAQGSSGVHRPVQHYTASLAEPAAQETNGALMSFMSADQAQESTQSANMCSTDPEVIEQICQSTDPEIVAYRRATPSILRRRMAQVLEREENARMSLPEHGDAIRDIGVAIKDIGAAQRSGDEQTVRELKRVMADVRQWETEISESSGDEIPEGAQQARMAIASGEPSPESRAGDSSGAGVSDSGSSDGSRSGTHSPSIASADEPSGIPTAPAGESDPLARSGSAADDPTGMAPMSATPLTLPDHAPVHPVSATSSFGDSVADDGHEMRATSAVEQPGTVDPFGSHPATPSLPVAGDYATFSNLIPSGFASFTAPGAPLAPVIDRGGQLFAGLKHMITSQESVEPSRAQDILPAPLVASSAELVSFPSEDGESSVLVSSHGRGSSNDPATLRGGPALRGFSPQPSGGGFFASLRDSVSPDASKDPLSYASHHLLTAFAAGAAAIAGRSALLPGLQRAPSGPGTRSVYAAVMDIDSRSNSRDHHGGGDEGSGHRHGSPDHSEQDHDDGPNAYHDDAEAIAV